jgi:hypothetical protein
MDTFACPKGAYYFTAPLMNKTALNNHCYRMTHSCIVSGWQQVVLYFQYYSKSAYGDFVRVPHQDTLEDLGEITQVEGVVRLGGRG